MKTSEQIKKEQDDLLEAAKPLIKYLNERHYPYITAIVDCTDVTLVEDKMMVRTLDFLVD